MDKIHVCYLKPLTNVNILVGCYSMSCEVVGVIKGARRNVKEGRETGVVGQTLRSKRKDQKVQLP